MDKVSVVNDLKNSLGGAGKAEGASGAGRMVNPRSSAKRKGKKRT